MQDALQKRMLYSAKSFARFENNCAIKGSRGIKCTIMASAWRHLLYLST